jgi:sialate O-acetylesterase
MKPYFNTSSSVLAALAVFASGRSLNANVMPSHMFTDNMVLQQQLPIAVWGTADPMEQVTVTLKGISAETAAASDGNWRVELPAMEADGKPGELMLQGKNRIVRKNVLLGEVWICGGQSNMGRPVSGDDAQAAEEPQIRLSNDSGETPRRNDMDDTSGWTICSPQAILSAGDSLGPGKGRRAFTEVGYHFGVSLHAALKLPIGLVQVNCGGSTARDWTPPPADVVAKIEFDQRFPKITHQSGLLYFTRIRPITKFAVRGVIWYQGEDDGRNMKYGEDLTALIAAWREAWNRPELPFYMAQIAPTTYAGGMLHVWQDQVRVVSSLPHTGLAVSNDIYDGTNVPGFAERIEPKSGWPIVGGSNPHPTGRPKIARRLADIALAKTYHKLDREIFGPTYASHSIQGDKIVVKFDHVAAGLKSRDGKSLDWFEIAAAVDGRMQYVKADARIVAPDSIEVYAAGVKEPSAVRFAWHPLARHNLVNGEGLPAVSFLTEPAKPAQGR